MWVLFSSLSFPIKNINRVSYIFVTFPTLDTVDEERTEAQGTWQLRRSKRETGNVSRKPHIPQQAGHRKGHSLHRAGKSHNAPRHQTPGRIWPAKSVSSCLDGWNHKGFSKKESPHFGSRRLTHLVLAGLTAGQKEQRRPAHTFPLPLLYHPSPTTPATPSYEEYVHYSNPVFSLAPPIFHRKIQRNV